MKNLNTHVCNHYTDSGWWRLIHGYLVLQVFNLKWANGTKIAIPNIWVQRIQIIRVQWWNKRDKKTKQIQYEKVLFCNKCIKISVLGRLLSCENVSPHRKSLNCNSKHIKILLHHLAINKLYQFEIFTSEYKFLFNLKSSGRGKVKLCVHTHMWHKQWLISITCNSCTITQSFLFKSTVGQPCFKDLFRQDL